MVQKIHPRCVIWGALFPSPSGHFFKKNQLSVLSIYIVVLGLLWLTACSISFFCLSIFQCIYLYLYFYRVQPVRYILTYNNVYWLCINRSYQKQNKMSKSISIASVVGILQTLQTCKSYKFDKILSHIQGVPSISTQLQFQFLIVLSKKNLICNKTPNGLTQILPP